MKTAVELWRKTPLWESEPLSKRLGKRVFLKMETFQPSGSFKNRGIGLLCSRCAQEGAKGFVCPSGGNAGLAVAYSAKILGLPSLVVVPETTSEMMRERLKQQGAELVVYGANWNDTDPKARQLAASKEFAYIPPFDHPVIWEGHATLIEEVAAEGVKPDQVVLAVGGGGLFCGVLEGLHRVGWQDVPVLGVETEGAASFAKALQKNALVKLDAINTIAVSLGATQITEQVLKWKEKHHPMGSLVITDRQALDAVWSFLDDHRILVEPACGVALAPAYLNHPKLKEARTLLIVVCGGVGVSRALLEKWEGITHL